MKGRGSGRCLLDIVPNGGQWKVGTVTRVLRMAIDVGDRTGTAVWTSQAVQTDDEESCDIKRSTIPSYQGSPPVSHIGTARQCVTDDYGVVAVWSKVSANAVGNGNIAEDDTRFEGELGDDDNVLVRDEGGERVFGLTFGFLYGI